MYCISEEIDQILEEKQYIIDDLITRFEFINKFERDDIYNAGLHGLYIALVEYDENKHTPFEAYARIVAQRAMSKCYEQEIKKRRDTLSLNILLDTRVGDETNKLYEELINLIATSSHSAPNIIYEKMLIITLKKAIHSLDKKDQYLIFHFYGAFDYERFTRQKILDDLGISHTTFNKRRKKALHIVRKYLEKRGYEI